MSVLSLGIIFNFYYSITLGKYQKYYFYYRSKETTDFRSHIDLVFVEGQWAPRTSPTPRDCKGNLHFRWGAPHAVRQRTGFACFWLASSGLFMTLFRRTPPPCNSGIIGI